MWYAKFQLLKSIFCIVVLIATIQSLFAQSYSHSPNDSIVANAVYDDFNVYNIIQNHPTNDTLLFKWKKHFVSLPITWEASICDVGHCYTSLVDSSTMDPIVVGDNGLISLHLNPHFEAGTGTVQVLFWETKTPTQIDTLTWIITASGSVGINTTENKKNIAIYPNPATNIVNIITPFDDGFEYKIIDANGKIVAQNFSKNKIETINIERLKNGNYVIQISSNKQLFNFKIIKK